MHDDERVVDELEALKAILMDELVIKMDERGQAVGLETEVFPWTALDTQQQFVRVMLEVDLPEGYPDKQPHVALRNPRGLDDSLIDAIYQQIREKCEEYLGQPVIFEIIEIEISFGEGPPLLIYIFMKRDITSGKSPCRNTFKHRYICHKVVKENLTASNVPCCQCCICLYGFRDGDHFTKTHCYHYFHSHCLAGHLTASERIFREEQDKLPAWKQTEKFQAVCPVCRAPIKYDINELSTAPPPIDVTEAPRSFEPSDELRRLQQQMAALFLHQKQRGGIIQEENHLLLLTDEPAVAGGNR